MANNKISGWYYDIQQENPMTCVTLHFNTYPVPVKENGQIKDVKWMSISTSDAQKAYKDKTGNDLEVDPDDDYMTKNINGEVFKYSKNPLIRAIVSEDFNVSIANTWSDFGGDLLGQMWQSVKTLAPYADVAEHAIQQALETYRNSSEETKAKIEGSGVARAMHHVLEKIGSNPGTITDYLNRSLVVQGTRFSYYSGTGVSFGNLVMKFTVFPKWEGNKFISVNSQINDLYPYLVGKFEKETGLPAGLENFVGWQKPPAGFKANLKDVDVVQEGTLKLKYGPYYAITNLVCENATFNFSKQMVKKPFFHNSNGTRVFTGSLSSDDIVMSPLYCDVTIQLRPATKFSDISLQRFVNGLNCSETIRNTSQLLEQNIENELNSLRSQYN